jgi:hypothetical protein
VAERNNENVSAPNYNRNKPGPAGKTQQIPVRIVREETVIMTPEQLDNAVEALAVLLTRHWDTVRADPARRHRDDLTLAA